MTKVELLTIMKKLNDCSGAIKWVEEQPDDTADSIWSKCERPDWLLWLAGKADIDRKVLVTTACQIARTALKYVPEGEERPRKAIEAAEDWVEGKVSLEEVQVAAGAVNALYAACVTDYMANDMANMTSAAYRMVNTVGAAAQAAALVTETYAREAAWLVAAKASALVPKNPLAKSTEIVEIVKKYISWEMVEEHLAKI